jgi:methyl-accepting chemotaxis protein
MQTQPSFRYFSNLSVGKKMLAIVSVSFVGLIVVAARAITQMSKIGDELSGIAERDVPLTIVIGRITAHQLEQAVNYERAVRYAESPTHNLAAKEKLAKAVATFEALSELCPKNQTVT